MPATITRRAEHASNLDCIRNLSGDYYYRKMTFQEAQDWLISYEYYEGEGYPREMCAQYSWDHYFAVRTKGNRL